MGTGSITSQSILFNHTHSSEEKIFGQNVLSGLSLIGKGITVDNGLINIRSGDLKALTGGIVLQLNELPSKSPSATKRLAGAHISIVPENPRAGSILIASGGDPATTQSVVMQNMGAKLELDKGPLSNITLELSLINI